jgi:hypothetical protein
MKSFFLAHFFHFSSFFYLHCSFSVNIVDISFSSTEYNATKLEMVHILHRFFVQFYKMEIFTVTFSCLRTILVIIIVSLFFFWINLLENMLCSSKNLLSSNISLFQLSIYITLKHTRWNFILIFHTKFFCFLSYQEFSINSLYQRKFWIWLFTFSSDDISH